MAFLQGLKQQPFKLGAISSIHFSSKTPSWPVTHGGTLPRAHAANFERRAETIRRSEKTSPGFDVMTSSQLPLNWTSHRFRARSSCSANTSRFHLNHSVNSTALLLPNLYALSGNNFTSLFWETTGPTFRITQSKFKIRILTASALLEIELRLLSRAHENIARRR